MKGATRNTLAKSAALVVWNTASTRDTHAQTDAVDVSGWLACLTSWVGLGLCGQQLIQ